MENTGGAVADPRAERVSSRDLSARIQKACHRTTRRRGAPGQIARVRSSAPASALTTRNRVVEMPEELIGLSLRSVPTEPHPGPPKDGRAPKRPSVVNSETA